MNTPSVSQGVLEASQRRPAARTLVAGASYVPVDSDDPDERAHLVFAEAGAVVVDVWH